MNFIIDEEINLNTTKEGGKSDLLNTKHYADILLQSIKDAPASNSYTIGLFGEWGSGKSSVIKTMTESIHSDKKLKKVKIVNYDAWKYSGDSFRRMFLYELRKALGLNESPLMQRFYINETEEVKIKTSINWKKILIVFCFIVVAGIAIAVINSLFGKEVTIPSTIALIALLFSLWSFVFDQLKVTTQKPLLFAPEQFEECYKLMIGCSLKKDKYKEQALKWISFGAHHEEYQRILIIIDNIDRCQPDIAYSLLTDIKNFLCKEFNVIFVVPVDIEALRKHVIKASKEGRSNDADEFLRKFFNTSIWMKPFQNDEMFNFANHLAQKNKLDFKPDTISLVANEFATNPRRIIQLFNNLQIDLSSYESEFAKEHQALICKLLIIREEFPAYYKQLLLNPWLFYVDVIPLLEKEEESRTEFDRIVLENSRLVAFLIASAGISTRYAENEEILSKVLVNSQIKYSIPENVRQSYRVVDKEAILNYTKEKKNCDLLVDYLQDNIKKMTNRDTIEAEGKTHINVLLVLFEQGLLTPEDKIRLMSSLDSIKTLSKCIKLYSDKESLISLGMDLERISLPKLSTALERYFSSRISLNNTITNDDAKNIFYAASIWGIERCKKISEVFFHALQKDIVTCRKYEYSKDKYNTLFTKNVYNYIFENIAPENCLSENSVFQFFHHLCHIQAVSKDNLIGFIEKATEKAPIYNYNNPNNVIVKEYFLGISNLFYEAGYLGQVIPQSTITSLFNKMNAPHSVSVPNRGVNTYHSMVNDMTSDEEFSNIINSFFRNVNRISDGPVVSCDEVIRFMKVESNHDLILESLIDLKRGGVDVTSWGKAVIKDKRRTDVRRLELLENLFTQKNKDEEYIIQDADVKHEIGELINLIQAKVDGFDAIVSMFNRVLSDERIDKIVRDILSTKTLEEQKQLPLSLMQRAIDSFEQNVDQLDIQKDLNIFILIVSKGSDNGLANVWSKINPILADSKSPNQIINNACQILLSFDRLTKDQADALAGNVNTLRADKITEEKKKEILAFLKKQQDLYNDKE